MEILKKGTAVLIPLKEEGTIVKYNERIWASYYDVKITKSSGFNEVGDIIDVLVRDVKEKPKNNL